MTPFVTTAMVEIAAQAIADLDGLDASCWLEEARAALLAIAPDIARAVKEECAKVAEQYLDRWEEPEHAARAVRKLTSAEIAATIRAIPEDQP